MIQVIEEKPEVIKETDHALLVRVTKKIYIFGMVLYTRKYIEKYEM